MADDDITPSGKGNPDVHRAHRAFIKSIDASRAVTEMAELVSAGLEAGLGPSEGIPISDLDEEDSLVISIETAMNTQRSPRAYRGPRAKTNNR